jgi:hypothetical protein
VSVRLTGALVAALAVLVALPPVAAAAFSRNAQKVYDDYRTDAAIQTCAHTVKAYRRTLREITPDVEEETPAFRPAVEAALRERERGTGKCESPVDEGQTGDSSAGAGGGSPSSPAPPATAPAKPAPAKPAPAAPAPAPSKPAPANAAPQATPTATVAPAPPVTSSAPTLPSDPVLVDNPREGTPLGLLIALGVLALALLLVLAGLAARRFDRFPGARHAWGEAAYRAGGTWGDFVDWMRLGRS